jgi:hypothetical protein
MVGKIPYGLSFPASYRKNPLQTNVFIISGIFCAVVPHMDKFFKKSERGW